MVPQIFAWSLLSPAIIWLFLLVGICFVSWDRKHWGQ